MSPIQGKIGKTTKNAQKRPAGKWLGSQPRCFPTGESRGNPEGIHRHIPTPSLAQVGAALPLLHGMFVSLLSPHTWEWPLQGERTEQERLQNPGGEGRSLEWGRNQGLFQLLFAPRHPLEAGMGLWQVENPHGGPRSSGKQQVLAQGQESMGMIHQEKSSRMWELPGTALFIPAGILCWHRMFSLGIKPLWNPEDSGTILQELPEPQ